jgi:aspartate aminotransferase
LEYSHSAGNESYRKKLCAYYKSYNINIDYTEVIITCGGSEAIEIAMKTCFNDGR